MYGEGPRCGVGGGRCGGWDGMDQSDEVEEQVGVHKQAWRGSWDDTTGDSHGKRSRSDEEFLALLENDVEAFDAAQEEEDLRLAGKEQLISRVMKSLEGEISNLNALPVPMMKSVFVGAPNCCLQSDSAVSMSTSASRLSDPKQLNIESKCRCISVHETQHDGDQLAYLLEASNEQLGLLPSSDSEIFVEDSNSMDHLTRIESSSSLNELLDWDVWEI
eukprot:Gb_06460 [translate_table: standard]